MSNTFLLKKKPFTCPASQTWRMNKPQNTRVWLARNLGLLKQATGMTQAQIAKRASQFCVEPRGISQKTISNMLSARHSSNVDDVAAVAQVFGLNGWQIIMPNLPGDLLSSNTIGKLFENYISSSPKSRKIVDIIAENEAGKLDNNDDDPIDEQGPPTSKKLRKAK